MASERKGKASEIMTVVLLLHRYDRTHLTLTAPPLLHSGETVLRLFFVFSFASVALSLPLLPPLSRVVSVTGADGPYREREEVIGTVQVPPLHKTHAHTNACACTWTQGWGMK